MQGAERAVAHIYNSAVAASAIAAAWELGALDQLNDGGVLDTHQFAVEHRLDPAATAGLFRALASVGIVQRVDTKVVPAANFAEVMRTRAFFHWLTMGSAELFRRIPDVLRTENRTGEFYRRDSAAIAFACREISTFCYDPWFWRAVDALDFRPRLVADLGCGSGERLLQVLRQYPTTTAIGIDLAQPALDVAVADATHEGLTDRVRFVRDDVLALTPRPDFAEVDLLTCFMMGHDFWPREQCVAVLRHLRAVFPGARRFLLGDATRTTGFADKELPTFTLGFELAHDLMGTFIPTVEDWESVFEESGWRLCGKDTIDIAVGEVVFELARLDS
jgi:SAM-dependent methyltransferase